MLKMKSWLVPAAIFPVAGCDKGLVPAQISGSVTGKYSLPAASPSETYSVNAAGLCIKAAYATSDGADRIALAGTIDNGIPEGLLWNENTSDAFGIPSGVCQGRGDFKIGTLSAATGGSAAIGPRDFDTERLMADCYTAVVLKGLVENYSGAGLTVTETNDSLRLLSRSYRASHSTLVINDDECYKKESYNHDPNRFEPEGADTYDRGGYAFLISKKPQTASFEVSYQGQIKKVDVDYNEVLFHELPSPAPIEIQTPSPGGHYMFESKTPDVWYTVSAATGDGSIQADYIRTNPLYIRSLYQPVDIDPKKTTTHTIRRLWITDESDSVIENESLILKWNDEYQVIELSVAGSLSNPLNITIHAEPRPNLSELFFDVAILP